MIIFFLLKICFIRITCLCNTYPLIPHFYVEKLGYAGVYLIFTPKHRMWVHIRTACEAVLMCTHNLCFEQNIKNFLLKIFIFYIFMHQSFASPAPPGPGNSGAFNFSIFKARLKARHCRARVLVKPLLKAPAPQGLTITWNNSWELF